MNVEEICIIILNCLLRLKTRTPINILRTNKRNTEDNNENDLYLAKN